MDVIVERSENFAAKLRRMCVKTRTWILATHLDQEKYVAFVMEPQKIISLFTLASGRFFV